MRKLLGVLLAVVFATGCNTIEGMGKDITKAGEKIEESVKKK